MVAAVACGGDTNEAAVRASIAEGCSLNSDCSSPLICAFKTCHRQCEATRDCINFGGGLCVQSEKPFYVCQTPTEEKCVRNSDCPGNQVCGTDQHCRDACLTERDCLTGQKCVTGVCAEPEELVQGALPQATTEVAEGRQCVHASDCPGELVCLSRVCAEECVTAKDCPADRVCQNTRCIPASAVGVGGAAGAAGRGGSGGAAAGTGGTAGAAGAAAGGAGAAGAPN
jgi:hypothetical protein